MTSYTSPSSLYNLTKRVPDPLVSCTASTLKATTRVHVGVHMVVYKALQHTPNSLGHHEGQLRYTCILPQVVTLTVTLIISIYNMFSMELSYPLSSEGPALADNDILKCLQWFKVLQKRQVSVRRCRLFRNYMPQHPIYTPSTSNHWGMVSTIHQSPLGC